MEISAIMAHSPVPVESRAAVCAFDESHDHQEDRAEEDQGKRSGRDIEAAFCQAPGDKFEGPLVGCQKRRSSRTCRGLHRENHICVLRESVPTGQTRRAAGWGKRWGEGEI